MTKHLSQLLEAPEPTFRLQLRQLERTSGHQNRDITLSVEVMHAAQAKVARLGLDNHNTTAEELYQTLLSRVSADDQRLERALRTRAASHISAEADLMAGMVHALEHEVDQRHMFSIKPAVVRKQLKKLPAKRLQKMLGYRSLDAMLRAENPALLVAAAQAVESIAWRRAWRESYRQLTSADCNDQPVKIISPKSPRWQKILPTILADQAHTVLAVPELATLILLPVPAERPSGMVIATVALALQELNNLATASSYLRASQIQTNFGSRLQAVARGNVQLEAADLPQAISWQLVEQFFIRSKHQVSEEIFGPFVQASDFGWHNVEAILAKICPSLSFWEDSNFISYLHQGHAVSCNIVDAAINSCNQLTYKARSIEHAQQALWNELSLRYLDRTNLEAAIAGNLQPPLRLAPEMAGV